MSLSPSKAALIFSLLLSFAAASDAAATSFGATFERLNPTLPQPEFRSDWMQGLTVTNQAELQAALWRADALFTAGEIAYENGPLAVLLSGSEVRLFVRENYRQEKDLVDLAARLSGLGVVDLSVAAERLGQLEIDAKSLQPFVGVFVSAEPNPRQMRKREGFIYF